MGYLLCKSFCYFPGTAECIYVSTSLIAITLFTRLFLKDRIEIFTIVAVCLCCIGVVLLIQPEFLFPQDDQSTEGYSYTTTTAEFSTVTPLATESGNNRTTGTNKQINQTLSEAHTTQSSTLETIIGYTSMFACGIITPTLAIFKKGTRLRNYSVPVWMLWNYIINSVVATVVMLATGEYIIPDTLRTYALLSIHIVTIFGTQTFYFLALKFTTGIITLIVGTNSILLYLLAQYTITRHLHPGHRNAMEIIGAIIVFVGAMLPSAITLIKLKCATKLPKPGAVSL